MHWIESPHYFQITGQGDFTKINLDPRNNDGGGELDPHGADGNGNPVGECLLVLRPLLRFATEIELTFDFFRSFFPGGIVIAKIK